MNRNFIVLFVLTTLLGGEAVLAAKCKFREDTDDMFSGVPTLRTTWNKNDGIVSGVEEFGKQWLEIKISYSTKYTFLPTQADLDKSIVVPQGANLEVTLKDGALIELPAAATVKGSSAIEYPYSSGNRDYVIYVQAKSRYALSESAISALAAQKATRVRVHGAKQYQDITIPKKGFKQIMEAVTCLRQGESK